VGGWVEESQISEKTDSGRDCLPLQKELLMRHLQLTPNKMLCRKKLASCVPKVTLAVRWKRDFLQIRSKN